MSKHKSGHIVGISTVLVDQPLAGATITLQVITKSTMSAFHRALVVEFVSDGIRANTISPSVVDTPMHAKDDYEILKKRPTHSAREYPLERLEPAYVSRFAMIQIDL